MGRDHNRRLHAKRHFRQTIMEEEEGDTVDDLAHAAQFAIVPGLSTLSSPTEATKDDKNEIEVDDDDDDDDSIAEDSKSQGENNNNNSSSSSDGEESDEDLVEALQKMEEANATEEDTGGSASKPPKTENEVDGYSLPIQELESQLQIRLTVDNETMTNVTSSSKTIITDKQLSLAGTIKNFMLVDRTVVVESGALQRSKGPLDEGSMLVVKKAAERNGTGTTATNLIPLGRIFEVFGPVSQPLYTVRLPSPPFVAKDSKPSKPKSNDSQKMEERTETTEVDKIPTTGPNATKDGESRNQKGKNDHPNSNNPNPMENKKSVSVETKIHNDSIQNCQNESVSSNESLSGGDNPEQIPAKSLVDPWEENGEFAKYILQNKNIEVYYIQDDAKLIDTGLVLRSSGKGCDASNIYDEEIVNSSEAYYSDDEKEREAKNHKKKKKNSQRGTNRMANQRPHHQHSRQIIPPPPSHHIHGSGQLPQGFHPVAHHQTHPSYNQYPPQSVFYRQGPPPPPPPYQGNHPQRQQWQPVPPPPPRNPNEPPAYQY